MIEANELTMIETIEDVDEVKTRYFGMYCTEDIPEIPQRAEKGDIMIFSKDPDTLSFGDIVTLYDGSIVEFGVDVPTYMICGKLVEVRDSRF